MATLDKDDKEWLKRNLITRSESDINVIKSIIKVALEDAIEEKQLVTKDDISHLPTKDEFYSRMDKLMGEIKKVREEHTVLSGQSRNHSNRLEKLEKIHPDYQHQSAS